MTKQPLSNRLRELRKQQGLTQKQVALLMGFKIEDRISHWEKGIAVPGLQNLFRLCSLYNVTPMYIYSELYDDITKNYRS